MSENVRKDMDKDAWSNQVSLQELKTHDVWELRYNFIQKCWPEVKGMKVVEVGSGPAHDSLGFAQRGAYVTAVDYSERGLNAAKDIYRKLHLPILPILADAAALPFKSASFDIAFNAGVLEHFEDDALKVVIAEMTRVVRPGGWVMAFCPNRYNLCYQYYIKRCGHRQYDYERAFSSRELCERFHEAGLTNIEASGIHVHPAIQYFLPAWLPKHHKIEPMSRKLFSWLERCARFWWLKSILGQDIVVWGRVRK